MTIRLRRRELLAKLLPPVVIGVVAVSGIAVSWWQERPEQLAVFDDARQFLSVSDEVFQITQALVVEREQRIQLAGELADPQTAKKLRQRLNDVQKDSGWLDDLLGVARSTQTTEEMIVAYDRIFEALAPMHDSVAVSLENPKLIAAAQMRASLSTQFTLLGALVAILDQGRRNAAFDTDSLMLLAEFDGRMRAERIHALSLELDGLELPRVSLPKELLAALGAARGYAKKQRSAEILRRAVRNSNDVAVLSTLKVLARMPQMSPEEKTAVNELLSLWQGEQKRRTDDSVERCLAEFRHFQMTVSPEALQQAHSEMADALVMAFRDTGAQMLNGINTAQLQQERLLNRDLGLWGGVALSLILMIWLIAAVYRQSLTLDSQRMDLEKEYSKTSSMLVATVEGILGLSLDGRVKFSNPSAAKILGCAGVQLEGSEISWWYGDDLRKYIGQSWRDSPLMLEVEQQGSSKSSEFHFKHADGYEFPVGFTVAATTDGNGMLNGSVLVFEDITERRQAEVALKQLAETDELTGLANRRAFNQALEVMITHARANDYKIHLAFVDLNKFKPINDTYGHDVGDIVLKEISRRLQVAVRDNDICARLGGDEFAVIVADRNKGLDSDQFKNKLITAISEEIEIEGQEIDSLEVGASIGLVVYPDDAEKPQDLLALADTRMYEENAARPAEEQR